MKYEKTKHLSNGDFRRLTGVKRKTFSKMLEILTKPEETKRKKGGRKSKISLEDMLLLTLEYFREYRTYFHIAQDFDVHETTVMRIVFWVENLLIKDGRFSLPGKKALLAVDTEYEVILVDVAETPIERPKRRQKPWYSGKKKRHTMKIQVVVHKKTRKIICTAFAKGKKHDFRLFKESKTRILERIQAITDSGFQGIKNLHSNSVLPKKKTKKNPLTREEKRYNRKVSSERVSNEHAIGFLKRFRILFERYRNRRKRFGLRFNLIAGLCNFDMTV